MADDTGARRTRRDEGVTDRDDHVGGDRTDAGGRFIDEGGYDETHEREDPGGRDWGGRLAAVLVVGGLALLLFPEPATSGVGSLLLVVGVFLWLVEAFA